MTFKIDSGLDLFEYFIILIKFIFLFTAVGHIFLSHSSRNRAKELDPEFELLKERTEFVFIICMSILLIYYFNPRYSKKQISHESSILFFMFGWAMIVTAKWTLFFDESPLYKKIIKAIS